MTWNICHFILVMMVDHCARASHYHFINKTSKKIETGLYLVCYTNKGFLVERTNISPQLHVCNLKLITTAYSEYQLRKLANGFLYLK